jgi:hypothetical protein
MSQLSKKIIPPCPDFNYRYMYTDCCGHVILIPITCRSRSCPYCSRISARRVYSRYRDFFGSLSSDKIISYALITLTTLPTASGSLSDTYRLAKRSLSKLFRYQDWTSNILGGLYCFEVSTRPDGSYHLHIHILVRVRDDVIIQSFPIKKSGVSRLSANLGGLSPTRLSEVWKSLTGAYIVDVFPCYESIEKVSSYLMKYLSKVPRMHTSSQRIEYDKTFFNTRRLSLFGVYYSGLNSFTRPNMTCLACGRGRYTISGEFLGFISSSSRKELRNRGLLLDVYG